MEEILKKSYFKEFNLLPAIRKSNCEIFSEIADSKDQTIKHLKEELEENKCCIKIFYKGKEMKLKNKELNLKIDVSDLVNEKVSSLEEKERFLME